MHISSARRFSSIVGLVALIGSLLLFAVPASQAAQGDLLFTVNSVNSFSTDANCTSFDINVSVTWTGATNDSGGGTDNLGSVIYDANGVVLWGTAGAVVSSGGPYTGIYAFFFAGAAPTARPFTIVTYDTVIYPSNIDEADDGLIVDQFVFDPAQVAGGENCSVLPLISGDAEPVEPAAPVPGCDALITIPASAVGAVVTTTTPVYWAPGEMTEHTFEAGLSLLAIGVDSSGEYYKVLFQCGYYWVPVDALGPNFDDVWNGAPLPTGVVS